MAQCVTCGASLKPGVPRCVKCGTIAENFVQPPPQVNPYAPPQPGVGAPPYGPQPQIIYVQQAPQIQVPQCTKNKVTAGLLAIFLGAFGVHKFYLGKFLQGILYLIFFWTYIPAILGFIEGIVYLTMKDEVFCQKYGSR